MRNRQTESIKTESPRLLFVVDHDFGALGVIMYFLYGQPMADSATILLPADVHDLHRDTLPVKNLPYQSLADISAVVDDQEPDLVLLFSGYLLPLMTPQRLAPKDLVRLLRLLEQKAITVATSDPFLGTFAAGHHIRNDAPRDIKLQRRLGQWLRLHRNMRAIRKVSRALKAAAHVLPAPVLDLTGHGSSYVSFCNPRYIERKEDLRHRHSEAQRASHAGGGSLSWLFVLAGYDLELQQQIHGEQGFVEIVVARLRDTLANGRTPTLIAPAAFIERVAPHFSNQSNAIFLPACSFTEFERRLLDAEIAFYWQYFSTSTFLRLFLGLPVFFFDAGRLAGLSEELMQRGLSHYYLGEEPVLLDVAAALDADHLLDFSGLFALSASKINAQLAQLPTPGDMVKRLLHHG